MDCDDDGEQLARQLDEDYQAWSAALPGDRRVAIRAWQRANDRFYQRIQKVLRADADDTEAERVAEQLLDAIAAGALKRDIRVWRGVRNSTSVFGVPNHRLAELQGEKISADGFLAVSASRQVAVGEFTKPSSGGGPVLLRVSVTEGTPAAWIALAGDPDMEYQRELLLSDGHTLRVGDVSYTGGRPVIDGGRGGDRRCR